MAVREHVEGLLKLHWCGRADFFGNSGDVTFLAALIFIPHNHILGALFGHRRAGRAVVDCAHAVAVLLTRSGVARIDGRVPASADRVQRAGLVTSDDLAARTALALGRADLLRILRALRTHDGAKDLVYFSRRCSLANMRLARVLARLPHITGLAYVTVVILAEESHDAGTAAQRYVHHGQVVVLVIGQLGTLVAGLLRTSRHELRSGSVASAVSA
uniref:Uncharacterized protein n=1 Tax=Rhipicephalus microplus TaxID=6941 RepID=A0A6M2DB81_RHIMP